MVELAIRCLAAAAAADVLLLLTSCSFWSGWPGCAGLQRTPEMLHLSACALLLLQHAAAIRAAARVWWLHMPALPPQHLEPRRQPRTLHRLRLRAHQPGDCPKTCLLDG
jgi:hypothetical protein